MTTGPGPWPLPDRTRLHDVEAAILGCCLYCHRSARETLADLTAEDFTDPRHRAVLAAIRAVLAQGHEPEPPLVLAAYARGSESNIPVNTFAVLLAELLGRTTLPPAAPTYRQALLEARWRRDAVRMAGRIAHTAEHGTAHDLHHVLGESLAHLGHTLARIAPPPTHTHQPHHQHDAADTYALD